MWCAINQSPTILDLCAITSILPLHSRHCEFNRPYRPGWIDRSDLIWSVTTPKGEEIFSGFPWRPAEIRSCSYRRETTTYFDLHNTECAWECVLVAFAVQYCSDFVALLKYQTVVVLPQTAHSTETDPCHHFTMIWFHIHELFVILLFLLLFCKKLHEHNAWADCC